MFNKRTLIVLIFVCVSFFGYVAFSDIVDTMYTEFYFDWTNNLKSITVDATWSIVSNVSVVIENKSTNTLDGKLYFVDSMLNNDWWQTRRVCKSNSQNSEFGQYISTSNSWFSIAPGASETKVLDLMFPAWYSGIYTGCVVYVPNTSYLQNWLTTVVRKAIFLWADVNSLSNNYNILVKPAFRRSNWDWYAIEEADFWFFVYQNGQWQEFYNSSKSWDPKIDIDSDGLWNVTLIPPLDGTQYLVALKWSGTISVGYTWLWSDSISGFNFFSGIIADNLSNEYVFKYYDNSFTGNYLRVWDTTATHSGNYDIIVDSDFTLMTENLTISFTWDHKEWFDLDKNEKINALEQTMVLDSYNRAWFITHQNHLSLSDFVTL